MRERRCFVQFIHPGGEHWPDRGDRKFWNREAHRRKFLKGRGRYITGGEAREGEIVFWGEWEPESRVLARYSDRVADGPHFLYEPFFVDHRDGAWRQNTDPFVFGERFHYTGCLQHTCATAARLRASPSSSSNGVVGHRRLAAACSTASSGQRCRPARRPSEFRQACGGMRPFSTLWSLRSEPEGSINGSIPTARWSRRKWP